ncbi:MAG TPA: bifunctional DNA primase/polymerase, partial [Pilimelia sp.]|nr:bifunctional DNA primase/polymerase [Pilimelia sp.]
MTWTFGPQLIDVVRLLDVPRLVDLVRLRRAALRYGGRGWAVTPGAYLSGTRFACGRPGCPTVTCHPALESWEEAATCDPARVTAWWRALPHTVLLATGGTFDVLEVPAHLGLRALGMARLHGHVLGPARLPVDGPVAAGPTGRWMFFVQPGDRLRPELDGQFDVVRHGRGSWVPAPPTRLPEGRVRWAVSPEDVHWQLPDSYAVQALLVDALLVAEPARLAAAPDGR